jgi:hypothetical protein
MESPHIDKRRLVETVTQHIPLTSEETQHLESCEECLELIRLIVRQQLAGEKGHS